MTFSPQFLYDFALVLVLSTAALLFFPAAHGSYSSVHGPVTALLPTTTKLLAVIACVRNAVRRLVWPSLVRACSLSVRARGIASRTSCSREIDVLRL